MNRECSYGVLSRMSDGRRSVVCVAMGLLEAESYVKSLQEDAKAIGYATTFEVIHTGSLTPACGRCGAVCQTCTDSPITQAEKDIAIRRIENQLAEWRARQTPEYLAELDRSKPQARNTGSAA